MSNDVEIGARVRVSDTDYNDLGLGTYEGEVAFDDDNNEIPAPPDAGPLDAYPKIRLDSGRIIYGFECWWTETSDELETKLAEIERIGKSTH